MKNILIYIVMCAVVASGSTACDKDAHKGENGLIVGLLLPGNDTANDIRLWVYQTNGLEIGEYHYNSYKELASTTFQLSQGDYTLIAATDLVAPFSTYQAAADGVKPYEGLVFQLEEASASPAHAHYGVQTVTVSGDERIHTEVKMSRILAELQFTITDVPANVIRAEANVTNVAKSFLPYSSQLIPSPDIAGLKSTTPQGSVISFSMQRLMPVVRPTSSSGTMDLATCLTFTCYYNDGSTITFDATAPPMQNGGIYTPVVSYDTFQPGITLTISEINGWKQGGAIEGEILNPNN